MNPMSAVLRRFTVPDLADFGLPAPPGDGFTQFLRTGRCRFSITASCLLSGPGGFAHAPGLHFVGIDVTLSGLLRDIGLEARAVGRALSAQRVHA